MANYSKKTSSGSSKTLMSGKAPISPLINNMSSRAPRNTILSPLGENSNLRREAFNRKQFDDTINTNFTELGVNTVDPSTFDPSLATVGDFFTIYQTLFYQIPKGTEPGAPDVNTHKFLIERSTEYTQFIAQQDEIEALTQEITDLRAQNLELVADMANIVTGFEQTISNLTEQLTNQ